MDIEKLQKVSALAKDLQLRGMAEDINEAMRMADSMLDKGRELSHIQDTLAGVPFNENARFSYSAPQIDPRNIPQPIAGYKIEEPITHVSHENRQQESVQRSQPSVQQQAPQQPVHQQAPQQHVEVRDNQLRLEVSNLIMKLDNQKKEITELRDNLGQLKQKLDFLEKQRYEHKPIMEKVHNQPQTSLHTENIKKAEPHPKVGGFNSGDVSVENIFYSGPPK